MNNLEFAISMERDGEEYYLKQAEKYKDNPNLKRVCEIMAKDERAHANIMDDLLHNVKTKLEERSFLDEVKSVFADAPDVVIDEKSTHKEIDFYESALKKEQASIDLYKKLREESKSLEEKAVFEFLISQEEDHYKYIEELIKYFNDHGQILDKSEFGFTCTIKKW